MSQLTLLIGRQRSGKSTTFAEIATQLDRKVLIIDPGRAPAYTKAKIPFLKVKDIPAFVRSDKKAARISDIINKKELVAKIYGFDLENNRIDRSKAFLNGNLIMEDAASYINQHMTETLRECIKAFKQYGLNLFLSYHSISEISPDILALIPHKAIFKKTGDRNKVFSAIKKTEYFQAYDAAMKAYYKAQFYGLTPHQILENYRRYLLGISKDLYLQEKDPSKIARKLSLLANGKAEPTNEQKAMANFMPFEVDLRL